MYLVATKSYDGDILNHESEKFFELEENALLYYNAIVNKNPIDDDWKVFIRKINTEDDNMKIILSNVEKFGY